VVAVVALFAPVASPPSLIASPDALVASVRACLP
jgi:hypothetical protein